MTLDSFLCLFLSLPWLDSWTHPRHSKGLRVLSSPGTAVACQWFRFSGELFRSDMEYVPKYWHSFANEQMPPPPNCAWVSVGTVSSRAPSVSSACRIFAAIGDCLRTKGSECGERKTQDWTGKRVEVLQTKEGRLRSEKRAHCSDPLVSSCIKTWNKGSLPVSRPTDLHLGSSVRFLAPVPDGNVREW